MMIDMRVSTFSRGFCTAIMRDHSSTHNAQKGSVLYIYKCVCRVTDAGYNFFLKF